MDDDVKEIVLRLDELNAISFGKFVLKSGLTSPIYVDLRIAIGQPDLLVSIANVIWKEALTNDVHSDVICGVPTGGVPIATCVAVRSKLPLIFCRKEAKDHGMKRAVDGLYAAGQKCVVVEDVFVSGQSTMETAEVLRRAGLCVTDAIVFLDRQQGGKSILEKEGITVHSVITVADLLEVLHEAGKIDDGLLMECRDYLRANQLTALPRHLKETVKQKKLSYEVRASRCKHPLTRRLFTIMSDKKTNLSLSADVTTCDELLKLADDLGPQICILKTHVDILKDFSMSKMRALAQLANKHSFLIFEDRKFADIGNTVRLQYEGGTYEICEWADLINAHPLPGPGVVEGLKKLGIEKGRACILVAQMSSVDHLCSPEYVAKTVDMANQNRNFVIGFICQSYLTSDPEMVHMVPGVKFEWGNDGLGQGYMTPDEAFSNGADIVIIGRGILNANDPIETARRYRQVSYDAYSRLTE